MRTVILNIPIEPIEDRYSVQWDKWFQSAFHENPDLELISVHGGVTSGSIRQGSFLDVIETNLYKNKQLDKILHYLNTYKDDHKLILFFHDLWNPALTSIAYVRDGMGWKNLRICGCLHSGSYDKFDFLNKQGMTKWAARIEEGWCKIVDKIFVATHYHDILLRSKRVLLDDWDKIVVTGFPLYDDFQQPHNIMDDESIPIIVFPHRLDSEKNPQMFDELKSRLPSYRFIKTKENCKTKESYYRLLKSSDVAVSFADQETWGIAMQEAVICGALPMCPNRLSYTEMYPSAFLFENFEECVNKIKWLLAHENQANEFLQNTKNTILRKGREAIPNMIKEIEKL